jgi:hypothetical protein
MVNCSIENTSRSPIPGDKILLESALGLLTNIRRTRVVRH